MADNSNLLQILWSGADVLRSKMDANEYKTYLLGIIFFKYLSDSYLVSVYDLTNNKLPESLEEAQKEYEKYYLSDDKDDLLEELKDSWELNAHDEEVKEETYREYVDEWIEEMKAQDKEYIENLYNSNSDDFHTFICDILGSGYYDQSVVNKLKEKLKNNSFGVNYEK